MPCRGDCGNGTTINGEMAPLSTTRTLFELRVGSAHTIEVLLQIRLQDINWWNSNLHEHECQLYKLIGRHALPCDDACRTEIEADRARIREAKEGQSGMKKTTDQETSNGRKRRGAGKKKGADEPTKQKRRKNAKDANAKNDNEEAKLKLLRATTGTWLMGKSIQICYMMENIDQSTEETLFFRRKETINVDESDGKESPANSNQSSAKQQSSSTKNESAADDADDKVVPLAAFRTWKKLPKRLNIWVFQFDPDNPTDLSLSEGGGFPRPELLPMADIFRSFGD